MNDIDRIRLIADGRHDLAMGGYDDSNSGATIAALNHAGNILADEVERLRRILTALITDPRVPQDAVRNAIKEDT